ncbi:MAG: hypothetical protein VCB26_14900, partial [Candidatus Hydrogenedentota bacterium]
GRRRFLNYFHVMFNSHTSLYQLNPVCVEPVRGCERFRAHHRERIIHADVATLQVQTALKIA